MLRSPSIVFLSRLLLLGALVAGSIAVVGYVRWAVKIDPFKQYRPGENQAAQQVGVRLEDVKLWHWRNGKLALACDVGRVDVRRDRQHLEFFEVKNGVYYGDKENFHFAGPSANYNAGFQMFQVNSGARVWNKDLDLRSEGMTYRQKIGRLNTQGEVTGRLFDGQVKAMNLVYWPNEKTFEAGPISWEGKLKGSAIQEVTGQEQSKPWKFNTEHMKREGDIEVWTNGTATDGEVIVKAPKFERNVKNDVLTATGGVQYFSKKANLICDQAVIYRREKRAVLTGNVSMLVKPEDQEKLEVVEIQPFRPAVPDEIAASRPKPPSGASEAEKKQNEELRSSKTARKYPVSINAEKIEYWYKRGERRATVTGSPQARQDFPNGRWRHMWTNKAYYDAEKETLKLVSSEGKKDTRVITSIGDDLIARTFLTSTKENGQDQYEGEGIEGVVISEDDDLNRRNSTSGGQPPPSGLRGPIGKRK